MHVGQPWQQIVVGAINTKGNGASKGTWFTVPIATIVLSVIATVWCGKISSRAIVTTLTSIKAKAAVFFADLWRKVVAGKADSAGAKLVNSGLSWLATTKSTMIKKWRGK